MKMSAPYFKFFPNDWLDSETVFLMTLEEEGAYIRTLALMWKRGGSVPDDPRWVSNGLRCTQGKWKKIRAKFLEIGVLNIKDSELFNPKLSEILQVFQEKSEKSSSSSKIRWENEYKKGNEINESLDANALRTQSHNRQQTTDNRQQTVDSREKIIKKAQPKKIIYPEWWGDELQNEFADHRRRQKGPLNQRVIDAHANAAAAAADILPPVEAIQLCIDKPWKGLKEEWIRNHCSVSARGGRVQHVASQETATEKWLRESTENDAIESTCEEVRENERIG